MIFCNFEIAEGPDSKNTPDVTCIHRQTNQRTKEKNGFKNV